jgi:hypothetical protein
MVRLFSPRVLDRVLEAFEKALVLFLASYARYQARRRSEGVRSSLSECARRRFRCK